MNVSISSSSSVLKYLSSLGTDRLSSLNKTMLPYPPNPITFRTFPDPRLPTGTHFRFIVSSCVTPNFPYLPLQGRRIKGFDLLANYLWPSTARQIDSANVDLTSSSASTSDLAHDRTPKFTATSVASVNPPPAEFLMFLGDFIYADVPFYFGDNKEAYRRLYRRNYMSKSFRKIYERLRECLLRRSK